MGWMIGNREDSLILIQFQRPLRKGLVALNQDGLCLTMLHNSSTHGQLFLVTMASKDYYVHGTLTNHGDVHCANM